MKNIIKIISVVLISFMLCGTVLAVENQNELEINLDASTVTIEGHGLLAGETYNLVVYAPGHDGSKVNESNLKSAIVFTDEIAVNDNGSFDVNIIIPEDVAGGQCKVVLQNGSTKVEDSFYYVTQDMIDSVCLKFNAQDANITELLETYSGTDNECNMVVVEVNLESDLYDADTDKLLPEVLSYFEYMRLELNDGNGFKTNGEIEDIFESAVFLYRINHVSDDSLVGLFDSNKDLLGILENKFYEDNKSEVASVFANIRTKQTEPINSFDVFSDIFSESLFVAEVNTTDNISLMDEILSKNAARIGTTKEKYTSFDSPSIGTYIVGQKFERITDIEKKVSDVMDDLEDGKGSGSSSGSSSGKGSGKGSNGGGIVLPVVVPTQPNSKTFEDLGNVSWAAEAIYALKDKNIVSGRSETVFSPNDSILREEITKMIVNLFEVEVNAMNSDFSDVDTSAWYAGYVAAAKINGIVNGIGNGMFGVGTYVSRQDVAVMIYRALSVNGVNIPAVREAIEFNDKTEISDYASDAITSMYCAGVINGTGDGKFNPKGLCTRAEAAKMLYEVMVKIKGE